MHGLQLPSPTVHLPSPSVAAPRFACVFSLAKIAQRSAALRAMAALTRSKTSSITTAMSSGTNIGWKRESLVLLSLAAPDRTLLLSGKTLPLSVSIYQSPHCTPYHLFPSSLPQSLLRIAETSTCRAPCPRPRTCRPVSATAHARRAARPRVVFTVMSLGRAWRRTCARRRCWRSENSRTMSGGPRCTCPSRRGPSACRKLAAWWGKAWLCVIGRGPGNTSRHSATPSRGRVRWCWPSLVWWSASMKPWADGLLPDSDTDVVWAAPGGF